MAAAAALLHSCSSCWQGLEASAASLRPECVAARPVSGRLHREKVTVVFLLEMRRKGIVTIIFFNIRPGTQFQFCWPFPGTQGTTWRTCIIRHRPVRRRDSRAGRALCVHPRGRHGAHGALPLVVQGAEKGDHLAGNTSNALINNKNKFSPSRRPVPGGRRPQMLRPQMPRRARAAFAYLLEERQAQTRPCRCVPVAQTVTKHATQRTLMPTLGARGSSCQPPPPHACLGLGHPCTPA